MGGGRKIICLVGGFIRLGGGRENERIKKSLPVEYCLFQWCYRDLFAKLFSILTVHYDRRIGLVCLGSPKSSYGDKENKI